jgi:lysophospholipase L1-like esterase
MNDQMIHELVRFTHLEKTYGYLPGMSETTAAALFGLDEAAYRDTKNRFDENARGAARELLEVDGFAGRVDRLPFRPGDLVLSIGDSITDDLQSWLEILRHLLGLRRPQDGIRVVNQGVSAQTTAMALRRFLPTVVAQKPDWVVCFLGGNDVTRVGPEPNKAQVGLQETIQNLEAMRRIASALTDARWVWITPPPFDEDRAAAYPPFQLGQSHWRNADVLAIAEFIREQEDPVVDLRAVFGLPVDPDLQGPDGVHPSLAGQRAIAGAFVERLSR